MSRITCRVCGEGLERQGTPPVSCMACDTPYHVDCWSFNGSRCGVYGCPGRRAMAGLASARAASPMCEFPAPHVVWNRALAPLVMSLATALWLAMLVGLVFLIPWGSLYIGLMGLQVSRLVTNGFSWLRRVTVDDDGITMGYLLGFQRAVPWKDVLRGPGAGDWTGAMQLANGEILLMPVGEPGFDEVLKRSAVALARRSIDNGPIYIGEDA